MPVYQYVCDDCSTDGKIKKSDLYDREEDTAGYHPNGSYLFFKNYPMKKMVPKPKCPKCGGANTSRSYHDINLVCYIRGDGIVKDRAGARRDMNRHHLQNGDPYGYMRQPGEVDHMLDQIRDAGRDMSKIRSEAASTSRETAKRARRMQQDDLPRDQERVLIKIEELGGSCRFSDLSEFDDVSGLLNKLMPEFVCESKDIFMLMAAGRAYVDNILNPD